MSGGFIHLLSLSANNLDIDLRCLIQSGAYFFPAANLRRTRGIVS